MGGLIQDLRYGLRILARSPGFTAVAVLTIALGIGVNTTLFTAFDAVALKPLPVRNPEGVVRLARTLASGSTGDPQYAFSYPEYVYYRGHNQVLSGLIGASWLVTVIANLPPEAGSSSLGEGERIQGQLVTANYFTLLGISAVVGRTFVPEDSEAPGTHAVIVLSDRFWHTRFNSDPGIVGKTVKLNDIVFTVIGVAPREFIGTANPPLVPGFWAPLAMQAQLVPGEDWLTTSSAYQIQLLGRLAPGIALNRAQAEATLLAQQFQAGQPAFPQDKTVAISFQVATYFGETNDLRFRAFVALLMVVVGMVLLVVCANVANMMLARSAARQREVGVRLAMGASRGRVIRQWLTESILLALMGGAVGLLLSLWTTKLLQLSIASIIQAMTGSDPSVIQMTPDFRVFGYTFLLAALAGVAFGLSPALQFSKPDLVTALKGEGTAFGQQVSPSRLRGLMVGGQVALSIILVLSAGLLVRGVLRSQTTDAGFETKRVFLMGLYFSNDSAKANALAKRVVERLTDLSAIQGVGLAYRPPWTGTWTPPIQVEDTKASPKSVPWQVLANYVSPGYFPTLGIPVLRGRNFTRREGESGAPVAVVSESAARRFWLGEDPVGKRFKLDLNFRGNWEEFEVIGVAKDVRTANFSRVDPAYIYLATDVTKLYDYAVLFRVRGETRAALASVRAALEDLDKTHFPPGMELTSLEEGPLRLQKFIPQAIAGFAASLGVLALLVALVGLYGVMSFTVSQRTHEIGVRMAVGATAPDILRWLVREGMRPAVLGAGIGLACSIAVATVLRAVLVFPGSPDILFGVSAFDPVVFVSSTFLFLSATVVGCYVPARRATKVDPMVALREL